MRHEGRVLYGKSARHLAEPVSVIACASLCETDARIVSAAQDVRSISALKMSEAPTRCPAPSWRWLYPWRENRLVTASTC